MVCQDGEGRGSVHERSVMHMIEVSEWVKCGTLGWFRHVARMKEGSFIKKVCDGKVERESG